MKKISLFCIVLAIVLLLFTSSCKTAETFNIVGTWTGILKWNNDAFNYNVTYTFSGDENSGTVFINILYATGDGNYTVTEKSVQMTWTWHSGNPASLTANGTASDDFNSISGTFTQTNGENGTWTASK